MDVSFALAFELDDALAELGEFLVLDVALGFKGLELGFKGGTSVADAVGEWGHRCGQKSD
jgi:hypothetical protein